MTATTVWGRAASARTAATASGSGPADGRVVDERRQRAVVVAPDEELRHARDAPDRRAELGLDVLPGRRPNGFHPPHDRDAVCYQAVPMQPAHSKFAVTPRPQAKPRLSTVATVGTLLAAPVSRRASRPVPVPSERIWFPTV